MSSPRRSACAVCRGRRPPGHLALEVADCIDKPLLVVPPEHARAGRAAHRVLIAMEGTPSRPQRLKRALQLVDSLGLDVIVVHVDDKDSIPSFSDQVQHETDAYADAFLAALRHGSRIARSSSCGLVTRWTRSSRRRIERR